MQISKTVLEACVLAATLCPWQALARVQEVSLVVQVSIADDRLWIAQLLEADGADGSIPFPVLSTVDGRYPRSVARSEREKEGIVLGQVQNGRFDFKGRRLYLVPKGSGPVSGEVGFAVPIDGPRLWLRLVGDMDISRVRFLVPFHQDYHPQVRPLVPYVVTTEEETEQSALVLDLLNPLPAGHALTVFAGHLPWQQGFRRRIALVCSGMMLFVALVMAHVRRRS